ncbi:Outer membrane hemin receptor [Flavobacteriaceae bacterium 3519-10]|nr:Outer membrane hemin receptor [Flavobacteriaceae bacterium 3519-10]
MKQLIKLVFFLFGITLVSAQQTFSVSGTVLDFHDKSALSNARIRLQNYNVVSDINGRFVVNKVSAGTYLLEVTHPDCETFSKQIKVESDIELTINLEHHSGDIEAVTIHGNHPIAGSVMIRTLSQEDISRNSTDNLGNLLKNISGLTALKTGNNISKPVIHGLYGTRISVINNGVKMAEQEWGVEHAPNVDVNQFEHIDVVKGASALKYGNESVGGVVVLEPAVVPKKDTLIGSVRLSGISNGKGAEVSAEALKSWENQWFVKSGGSYKKLGDQYVPHHTLQNTGAEVNSFNFSFGKHSFLHGFDVSYSGIQQEFGIFKGAHLGGPEDFYNAINFGQPYFLDDFSYDIANPRQSVRHHIAKIAAYKRFSGLGRLSFQYSFQQNSRKEYDIRKGDLNEIPSMDLTLTTHKAELFHLLERGNWSLESGISGSAQINFPDPATEARRLIPDYYRYDAGIFSVFKYSFTDKLNAEVGARYDFSRYDAYKYYDKSAWLNYAEEFPEFVVQESGSRILARPILDNHSTSANLGFNYIPTRHWNLKLNFSRTERAPNAAELFADGLHHSAAIMEEGDLRIKKEAIYSVNFSATAQAKWLRGFTLEVNPYFMYSDSFINQIPTGVKSTNRGVFVVWSYRQIEARMMGVDVDAQLQITDNLKWFSSFSALKGGDLSGNEPLILMMPANLRNALEWKSGKKSNFYIRVENENSFKQKRFPIRNQTVDFIENGVLVTREIDYSSTPASFSVFNASVGADVFKNVNLNFKVNNLLNTDYKEYLNRLRYFMSDPGRNFVATVQFKF